MSGPADAFSTSPSAGAAAPPERTLQRLFLTLFLRGRSSRGLRKESAPRSIGTKLAAVLAVYALFGLFFILMARRPLFEFSLILHACTFMFLGMFIAGSAGEVLFNKEEADILLHRPVTPRALLRAKIGMLARVSFWIAGAFNLAGFFAGACTPDGSLLFPLAHALSTAIQALLCTGCVVVSYQLCLRCFGRERLEGLMTTAQVLLAAALVLAGQLAPQLILRFGENLGTRADRWWVYLLPPAWFAGFDDVIAGSRAGSSWLLAGIGLVATAVTLWMALVKLARDYASGLQALNETTSPRQRQRSGRRLFHVLVNAPPLRWWLRDQVTRAAFLLTAAYLVRDRDVKLRVYPGVVPFLALPVLFLVSERGVGETHTGGFGLAFCGVYLGLVPLLALDLLRYSQHWQASDVFRAAPLAGPARLCAGARRSVLCVLALPAFTCMGILALIVTKDVSELLLLLPGLIAVPLFALVPFLGGKGAPLSSPGEEAKAARNTTTMLGVMLAAAALGGLATAAWSMGWFGWFLAGEAVVAPLLYVAMRRQVSCARWSRLE